MRKKPGLLSQLIATAIHILRKSRNKHEGSHLLHGSGGHAEAYVRNLAAHAEHFSTWSIDMLGHGYTDKPGHPLEISHYIDHLIAFFDTIGAEQVYLSGESLGGWVASRAAVDHPDRIVRLVLNTAGGSQADPEVMKRIITLSMAAAEDPSWDTVSARIKWLMADKSKDYDDIVASRQRIYRQDGFVPRARQRQRTPIPREHWKSGVVLRPRLRRRTAALRFG